ncbi:MAG: NTP transferase domain-containing protein [Candidatus Lokiarchaeota archaeon]|nr:NTP transferase domain-containing protein [Candidatus Lokiarchaeota archaeon]
MKIKKAIIPSAGLGTRLLPATFAQPKEMLPVGRKPTIQFVVEELANAGIKDILIVTGRNKRAIEDHFDMDHTLIENLRDKGKNKLLKQLQFLKDLNVDIFFTRQSKPTGLADAVLLGEAFIDDEPFVVSLGDTIIKSKNYKSNYLKRLCKFHIEKKSFGTIGVEEIAREEVFRYGIIEGINCDENVIKIKNLIEKPSPDTAPSNLAINGRYVFNPEIFDCIRKTTIGYGNERQLTDSIRLLLKSGDIWAVKMLEGEIRYDIGNPFDYAKAYIELSLDDPAIKNQLISYLKELIKQI